MDAGIWRGLFTLFMFVAFVGIVVWAYSSRRKEDFDEAANLPLQDDEIIGSGTGSESRIPTAEGANN